MLRPRFGVAEFVELKHEEADNAKQQKHHTNSHVQNDCVYFLGLFAGAGVCTNVNQLKDAAKCEKETDQRHHTDWQQNESESIGCISIAHETDARHTVAVHFAQRHYRYGQHERQ